jgi:selenocysteine-specific elongation factor
MTVVIGTAGHIDHGKTTLLRALTGIDADRLPEERRRGMTIDVGFAHMALPDGTELDFVDVPGHDRLVGNMLVGAGEIDAALLVVAADDGPRAQTIEHLELLDALGIDVGVAVVTKADAVDAGRAGAVAAETKALLDRTTLRGAEIVVVSAERGDGLPELVAALVAVRDRVRARAALPAAPRLGVDRVFSVRGRGTVVTGTLRGGPLVRGASLTVVPGGHVVRIRELQVHGRTVEQADSGRAAANLAASEGGGIGRGSVLSADPAVRASDRLLVALRPATAIAGRSTSTGLPMDRARVHLHLGTARVAGAVGRTARDSVELPGGEVTAILRLDEPVAVAPGDRFVLRRASPAGTLAGGRVLDTEPPRGVSRRRATRERLVALAAASAGSDEWHMGRLDLHGALDGRPIELADDVTDWLAEQILEAVGDGGERQLADVVEAVGRRLSRHVTLAGAAAGAIPPIVDALIAAGRLAREGGRLRDPARAAAGPSPDALAAMARLEAMLRSPTPPALSEAARATGCPPDGVRALESAGRIVRLDGDIAYARDAFQDLRDRALAMAAAEPLTPAAFRDATGTSRKYVMAVLEELDRQAVLRRTPAGHVPGPRAGAIAADAPR